jgi:hypothetical protein
MSRAREVSKVISTVENLDAVAYSSASPSGAEVGDLWVDTSTANPLIKAYDGNEWDTLGSTPVPIITGIAPDNISGSASTAVIINGSNFESGSIVKLIDINSTELFTLSTTFNNARSLQFLTPALTASAGPYDVKVTNPDNQLSILENSLTVGQSPVWSTNSGSLGLVYDSVRSSTTFSLLATDADNQLVSYELVSGSLPTGMSMTSGGVISGTAQAVASDTTYAFTIRAKDSENNFSDRSFNITTKAPVITQFTSVGTQTWTCPEGLTKVRALLVGGGGGGGSHVAGGGGGGAVINITEANVTPSTQYSITVGGGGNGGSSEARGSNGGNTTAFGSTAAGGGGGGSVTPGSNQAGLSGGSGGGAGGPNSNYGSSPIPGGSSTGNSLGSNSGTIYGNKGGNVVNQTRTGDPTCGTGGGGASQAGIDSDGNVANTNRSGGNGVEILILQNNYYWGGGGGGGAYNTTTGGNGGLGGGGGGAITTSGTVGIAGTGGLNSGQNGAVGSGAKGGNGGTNTGGGGGGGSGGSPGIGGTGGSGIVVIRY